MLIPMRTGPWLPGPEPERVERATVDTRLDAAAASGDVLPWSWAVQRLERSGNYWVATASAAGRPQLAPVRAVWVGGALYFSTGVNSAIADDLTAAAHCVVASENAEESVVVHGVAERVGDAAAADYIRRRYTEKYGAGFPNPGDQLLFAVAPRLVVGAITGSDDVAEHATRWRFTTIDD